tara:strand:- start:343 stop:972 length:630 start_codon:yes stop_codon:yes gene_type:complete
MSKRKHVDPQSKEKKKHQFAKIFYDPDCDLPDDIMKDICDKSDYKPMFWSIFDNMPFNSVEELDKADKICKYDKKYKYGVYKKIYYFHKSGKFFRLTASTQITDFPKDIPLSFIVTYDINLFELDYEQSKAFLDEVIFNNTLENSSHSESSNKEIQFHEKIEMYKLQRLFNDFQNSKMLYIEKNLKDNVALYYSNKKTYGDDYYKLFDE